MQPETGLNVLFAEIRLVEIREVEAQYTDAKAKEPITQKSAKNKSDTSTKDEGKKTTGKDSRRSAARDLYGWATNEGSSGDVVKDVTKKATSYQESLLDKAAQDLASQIPGI